MYLLFIFFLRAPYFLSAPYVAFIVLTCKQKDTHTRTRSQKKTPNKSALLNNEQANKVNSQRSFSCISVDFSGEDQQALFLSDSIHSCAAVKLGLWGDGGEIHTCRCQAIDILLAPFFLSKPPSPHSSPSPPCFLSWSLVANPSSRPPLARSGHLISNEFTLSLPPQPRAPKLRPSPPGPHSTTYSRPSSLLCSVFALLQPPITLIILSSPHVLRPLSFSSLSDVWHPILFVCSAAPVSLPLN